MFYDNRIFSYLREYLRDRIIAFGYSASPDRMVFHRYRPETVRQGVQGRPYINLSRKNFDDTIFEMFDVREKTGGLPSEKVTSIYATLSRYQMAPVIKKDFYEELLPYLQMRDIGYDLDTGIKSVAQIDSEFLGKCYTIIQPIWDSLRENKLSPTLKFSGCGFHVVAPLEPIRHEDVAGTIHAVSRYITELGLSGTEYEYRQNKFIIPDKRHPVNLEVQKDLNRMYTIPFSPYAKRHKTIGTEFENRVLLCMPLKDPSDIPDFRLERATPEHIGEIEIPEYPEPAKLRKSLIEEATEHYQRENERQRTAYPQHSSNNTQTEVSIDNLPPRYKYLEGGVSDGERNNSICTLTGVLRTCGLSKHDVIQELLKFNRMCRPPLPEHIVEGKVRMLYHK